MSAVDEFFEGLGKSSDETAAAADDSAARGYDDYVDSEGNFDHEAFYNDPDRPRATTDGGPEGEGLSDEEMDEMLGEFGLSRGAISRGYKALYYGQRAFQATVVLGLIGLFVALGGPALVASGVRTVRVSLGNPA